MAEWEHETKNEYMEIKRKNRNEKMSANWKKKRKNDWWKERKNNLIEMKEKERSSLIHGRKLKERMKENN